MSATREVRTSDLAAAQALASPYQRELLAHMPERELRQVGEFAYPEADPTGEDLGPLELRVGERTLTLPAREPSTLEALEQIWSNTHARMWARLYTEVLDSISAEAPVAPRYWRSRMDRIAGEELGQPQAAGQEQLPTDDNSPAARIARGLEPIRPAKRREA